MLSVTPREKADGMELNFQQVPPKHTQNTSKKSASFSNLSTSFSYYSSPVYQIMSLISNQSQKEDLKKQSELRLTSKDN